MSFEILVYRDVLLRLGPAGAIFFSYILHRAENEHIDNSNVLHAKCYETEAERQQLEDYLREADRGYFQFSVDTVQRDTGLTPAQQSRIVRRLVSLGLVEVHRRGLPCRRWFRFPLQDGSGRYVGVRQ